MKFKTCLSYLITFFDVTQVQAKIKCKQERRKQGKARGQSFHGLFVRNITKILTTQKLFSNGGRHLTQRQKTPPQASKLADQEKEKLILASSLDFSLKSLQLKRNFSALDLLNCQSAGDAFNQTGVRKTEKNKLSWRRTVSTATA